MRGKVEVINDVIHERKVLDKAALDRMRKQLYGVWANGYSRGKADAESYLLRCGDEMPKTNADRLRSLSDEELAKTLPWIEQQEICPNVKCDADKWEPVDCEKCMLDWLKKEVECEE